jgi:hypothetical protein
MQVRVPANDEDAIRRYQDEGFVIVAESLDESAADELDNNVCLAEALTVVMERPD